MPIPYTLLAVLLAALNAIGPFSIDTYLPAFPLMQADLQASVLDVQQSLTAYMLPFSFMMLWHGAISDALGRRRVILVGLGLYLLASLVCTLAHRIELLWLGRALQGLSAGAGVIVGRAILRDLLDGAAAQRLMSHVTMVFAVAPGVAPIVGGALATHMGWRAIFVFLALLAGALMYLVWRYLPETLPLDKRQSLQPAKLWHAYLEVLGNPRFVLLSLSTSLFFGGLFVYIMSAPVFLMEHLHLDATQFGWLFVPLVSGMVLGAYTSGRMAGRVSPLTTLKLAYALGALSMLTNIAFNLWLPPSIPTRVLPLIVFTFGLSLAMPTLNLRVLDMFPERRGLAASCQGSIQTIAMALAAGLVAPLLWHSTLLLAVGAAASLGLSGASLALALRKGKQTA